MTALPAPDLIAAGAVVTRKGPTGREVLLVHRPKYDDWSFPKGKRDPGEHVTQTACREVLEETGVEIRLGQPLRPQLYSVGGGRAKTVHYWVGQVVGDDDVSHFPANNEIDRVIWVPVKQAGSVLSYRHDVHTLEQFGQVRRGTRAFVLLRHARAQKRDRFTGPDDSLRPLTKAGKVQATNLSGILHAYGISEILSSSSLRCQQTVQPYATDFVFPIESLTALSEEQYDAPLAAELTRAALQARHGIVMCTHRPILPDLLEAIGWYEEPLAAGEMVICHHRKGELLSVERILVATNQE